MTNIGRKTITAIHAIGDSVMIDSDKDIQAVVTGVAIYAINIVYQVGWMHCGDSRSGWFDEFRLSPFTDA